MGWSPGTAEGVVVVVLSVTVAAAAGERFRFRVWAREGNRNVVRQPGRVRRRRLSRA